MIYKTIKFYKYKLLRLLLKEKKLFAQEKSFTLYKYSFFLGLIVPFIILLFTLEDKKIVYNYYSVSLYIIFVLIGYAFLLDVFWLLKSLWNKLIGKVIYTIIGYFAFAKSIGIAKNIIYINTMTNPDSFQASIHFLTGVYLIPSWLLIINSLLFILIIVFYFLFIIAWAIHMFIPRLLDTLKLYLPGGNGIAIGKILFHSFFTIIGAIMFTLISYKLINLLENSTNSNFTKEMIIKHSYYPNNTSCKKIGNDVYIKLLGDNEVSVSNYRTIDKLFHNNSIEFKTQLCR